MIDLDDLREKAVMATPGPWTAHAGTDAYSVTTPSAPLTWDDHGGEVFTGSNARHIAAFNPRVARALIDRCEAAEAAVARAREVHSPVECEPSDTYCAACSTLCGAGESLRLFPAVEWPCPTVRALDGEDA